MTLASWFSSLKHSRRRQAENGGRRNRSHKFDRSAFLEELEDRLVLSSVSFSAGSETVNASAGTFSVAVTLSGSPTASTFASGFNAPEGLAFDAAGNLYVANYGNGTVSEVTPAGQASRFASGFSSPDGLAFDAAGNLYVDNWGNGTVSEVTPAGVVSTFASGFSSPTALAFHAGNLYVANEGNGTVSKVSETVTVPFTLGGTAVSGTAFSGFTPGTLTFGAGQTTEYITGKLLSDPGPSQTLTFTLGTPTAGAALGSPSVNTLTITEPTPTPPPVPPVFVSEHQVFSGKGKHRRLVGFEFLFNGALNAADAQSTGNYRMTQKNGKKVKTLPVSSASYNDNTVTIAVGGFQSNKAGQVTIVGLVGADGAALSPIVSGL
jgi:hypothetical protein